MGLSRTFDALSALSREEALRLLETALGEPFAEIQVPAYRILVDRMKRPDVILQNYSSLVPEVRNLVVEQKWVYLGLARDLVKSGVERARRASYEFLADHGDVDAASILAQGVNDASTLVRDHAIGSLEKIALRYHYHLLRWQTEGNEESRDYIEQNRASMYEALETLLRTYQIHRKDIFLEIAVDAGAEIYRLISNLVLTRNDTPLYAAFQSALLRVHSRPAMDLLFRLYLERDDKANMLARSIFHNRKDAVFLQDLANFFSHATPDRFQAIASRLHEIPWWDALAAHKELDPAVAAQHRRLICEAALPPGLRERCLEHFLICSSEQVRAETLLSFLQLRLPSAVGHAKVALQDPSDLVRLAGARILVELGDPERTRLLAPFLQSANEDLRRIATREVAQASFQRYLASFDRLDPGTRELAAKAIAKIDDDLIDRISKEVDSLDPARRVKALRILDFTDKEKDAQPLIQEMINDPDRRVRATAVKLIEISGNVEGIKLLLRSLNDSDRRIRANAIEAFEDVGDSRFIQLLVPFCQDPDNRVRANAAKALWTLGRREGLDVLQEMLAHEDEKMRLSALWAIGEIRPPGAIELLSRRHGQETSPSLQAKITEVLARLQSPEKEAAP